MNHHLMMIAVVSLATLACRPLPGDGEPDYPNYERDGVDDPRFLPGASPWDGETPRLSLGAPYEGGATEEIGPGTEGVQALIYPQAGDSYAIAAELTDFAEGLSSNRLIIQDRGHGFWGGGIHYEVDGAGLGPQDFSAYQTLHLQLKSESSAFESFEIGLVTRVNGMDTEHRAFVSDHGFEADGEWHVVEIPISSMTNQPADLENVIVGALFIGTVVEDNADALLDDLYYTAEPAE